jgi:hypothetical protein
MAHGVPRAGAILSFIGGIFILIGGLIYAFVGAILSVFVGGAASILYVGIPIALLILVFSILLFVLPQLKIAWGALIVVLAFLSLAFDFFGGFVIGFLLCLIGGLMAIFAKSPAAAVPGWAPPPRCPACGGTVDISRRVCTQCGRAV